MTGQPKPAARRAMAAAVAAVALAVLPAASAAAEPPQRLDEQVVDSAGVVDDASAVQEATQQLLDEDGIQLFVVVVDTFDGTDAFDWAAETADLSGLGTQDPLLAVAIDDGEYSWSVDQGFELSDAELEDLAVDDLEPGLRSGDYDGAIAAYADGMRESAGGSSGGLSPGVLGVGALALVGVVGVGAVVARRSRRSREPSGAGGAVQAPAVSLEELDTRANRALVAADDAVRASDRELGFAQAEFGDAATAPFADALGRAKNALTQGFSLRQRLDDAEPETEQQRRGMLEQILQLCSQAAAELDAQTERFTELRDLAARIPELLPGLTRRLGDAEAGLPAARATVEDLARRFSPAAVGSVADSPDDAAERLAVAGQQLEVAAAGAGPGAAGGSQGEAAVALRAAEEAIAQAEQLLTGVGRTEAELLAAGNALPRAVSALHADVTALQPVAAAGSPGLAEVVAAGKSALAYAEQSGRVDPVTALAQVTRADAGIDAATAQLREAGERAQRAAAALPQALTGAQAQLAAAEDFIATHRGLVGGTARTRAAEAARVLAEAHAVAGTDPSRALTEAARAADLAGSASSAARSDVTGASGGQWGTPGGGVPGRNTTVVVGGGILDVLLGGGGGGWGGGGWSSGGGGFSGGSARGSGGGFGGGSRRGSGGSFGGGRRGGGRSSGGGRRGGRGRF